MSSISSRKRDHVEVAMSDASQSAVSAGWEHVHLVPRSLPKADYNEIDLTVDFSGHRLDAPFVIASMTGGHDGAITINERLAGAAQELGFAIGSGSQRAALEEPSLAKSYTIIRESAPDAVVMANIGVCQLVDQSRNDSLDRRAIETVVEMLDAQFLIVHLNVVEEVVQPEGDRNLVGLLGALERVVRWSPVPVIAKETGAGMSTDTALDLRDVGVAMLDVGGAGGTSFARVEGARSANRGDWLGARLGATFGDWGIPTAISVLEVKPAGIPLIATGGLRSGLDAAKAIALGASAVGIGRPALAAALAGYDSLLNELWALMTELRIALFLTDSASVSDLGRGESVLTGPVLDWVTQRGLVG